MNDKPIPVIRVNNAEINRVLTVFAASQELTIAGQEMERRVRSVPNGWRDLRLAITLLDKLAANLMRTVPPEKQPGVLRMARHMRIKLTAGPAACRTTPDDAIVAGADLDTLVDYAMESCKLCMGDCNACPLCKTLDRVLACDRNGRGWWEVGAEEIRTGGMTK